MAGKGQRFVDSGYLQLKPLLPIHGIPMISVVVRNLYSKYLSNVVLICQRETFEKVDIRQTLDWLDIPLTILCVDEITEGPADTVRLARIALNDEMPIVIANSDQFVNCSLENFYLKCLDQHVSGVVLTMTDNDPKWSYASVDDRNRITQIKEKVVISNNATVGIYGFSKARIAWEAFSRMWEANDRTNNEFYVAPAYNYIENNPAEIISLGEINDVMHGVGIPYDYEVFLQNPISKNFVEKYFSA